MIVFPAIDIQKGLVVRLRQGVENDSVTYFEDPVKTAVKWYEEGAASHTGASSSQRSCRPPA